MSDQLLLITILFLFSTMQFCQPGGSNSRPMWEIRVSEDDPDPFHVFNAHTRTWHQRSVNLNCVQVPCIRGLCPARCGECNQTTSMCLGGSNRPNGGGGGGGAGRKVKSLFKGKNKSGKLPPMNQIRFVDHSMVTNNNG